VGGLWLRRACGKKNGGWEKLTKTAPNGEEKKERGMTTRKAIRSKTPFEEGNKKKDDLKK